MLNPSNDLVRNFAVTVAVMLLAMAAGYVARRLRLLAERHAAAMMTIVAVFGYPLVGVLSIWRTQLQGADGWLIAQGVLHMAVMTGLGLLAGRLVTRDRGEQGLFGIASAVGNNGFTMGGFIIYLLFGVGGLALANIYFIMFTPVVILLHYPVARHYSAAHGGGSLGRLLVRSLLDWRSLGLPITLVGLGLSLGGVPRPAQLDEWHVIDVLMYGLTPVAYFAIGLRLHAVHLLRLWRAIVGLAVMRFAIGAAVGVGLLALTHLTPWPIVWGSIQMNVVLIEAFVPTAVTVVAVANMFDLRPQESSALFVANTAMYLVLILPLVLWLFGS